MSGYLFNDAIQKYCDEQAKVDKEFAKDYAKKNKSVDECVNYIVGEIANSQAAHDSRKGNMAWCGLEDKVVYGMVHHYFHEDDIKVRTFDPAKVVTKKAATKEAIKAEDVKAEETPSVDVSVSVFSKAHEEAEEVEEDVEEPEDEVEETEDTEDEDCPADKCYSGEPIVVCDALLADRGQLSGKAPKLNFKLIKYADKKSGHDMYKGVHYRKGHAFATNGFLVVYEKTDYPTSYEGTVRDKDNKFICDDSEEFNIKYPISQAEKLLGYKAKLDVDALRGFVAEAKKKAKEVGSCGFAMLKLTSSLCKGFRLDMLGLFLDSMKHLGLDEIEFSQYVDCPFIARDKAMDKFAVATPCLVEEFTRDPALEYYPFDLTGCVTDKKFVEWPVEENENFESVEESEDEPDETEPTEEAEETSEESEVDDDDDMYIPLF